MALVKLKNMSKTRDMVFRWDGRDYPLDKNGGELIVDENIAKHWIGDWTLKEKEEIYEENKRLKALHRDFPSDEVPIKFSNVVESVRTAKPDAVKKPPEKANPFISTSEEEEFEELKEIEKIVSSSKSKKHGK